MTPPSLIIPGYTGSGPRHWQSLWLERLPRARRIEQRDWERPDPAEWTAVLDAAIAACEHPPVLVAHSCGVLVVAHWALSHRRAVHAALLVAPPDVERGPVPEPCRQLAPIPLARLPFPSVVVASSDDPYASPERARQLAQSWGSRFVDAGAVGHLDTASGHGPWPEGEALLAELLRAPAPYLA